MTIRIYRGKDCLLHDMGAEHPECPDRIHAINDQLLSSGLEMSCEHVDAQMIEKEAIYQVHDKAYVNEIFSQAPDDGIVWLDDETAMMNKTLSAARYAAGAAVQAVDWVMDGADRQAFCLVRPPGHHAEKDKAMGFCFFNNIALATAHALNQYQLERVAVIDFDVHHGNGTQHIFEGESRVLMCSSFEHPLYPFTGTQPSADNIVAAPLEAGATGKAFREAANAWFTRLHAFKPELIVISAGFDAHAEDPMAHLRFNEDDYKWVSHQLRQLADTYCQGRIVSSLEGGYDLSALGRSVVAHLKGLGGDAIETGSA